MGCAAFHIAEVNLFGVVKPEGGNQVHMAPCPIRGRQGHGKIQEVQFADPEVPFGVVPATKGGGRFVHKVDSVVPGNRAVKADVEAKVLGAGIVKGFWEIDTSRHPQVVFGNMQGVNREVVFNDGKGFAQKVCRLDGDVAVGADAEPAEGHGVV